MININLYKRIAVVSLLLLLVLAFNTVGYLFCLTGTTTTTTTTGNSIYNCCLIAEQLKVEIEKLKEQTTTTTISKAKLLENFLLKEAQKEGNEYIEKKYYKPVNEEPVKKVVTVTPKLELDEDDIRHRSGSIGSSSK